MARVGRTGWLWLAATVLLALVAATLAAGAAGRRARSALAVTVRTDARLRAALLDSEIARFRLVPLALGDDRDVVAALAERPSVGRRRAARILDRKLEVLARTTGAAALYVVDRAGIAIAASNWNTTSSFVGTDYRFRRYVRDALVRGAASQYALGTVSRRPGLYLARRTPDGGVVVIKLAFDAVEADWARAGGDTVVRDTRGVIVVTSRPEWRFTSTVPLTPATLAAVQADAALAPGSVRLLRLSGDRVSAAVATSHPGWTLTSSRSAAAVVRPAMRVAAASAALTVAALAAVAWGLRQRASSRRRRTADLEGAVAARTAELTREIEERAASEARAADLRESLRQANRLATLGQVTASVAHETAQPVAAIRTYAATSTELLARGDHAAVRENLAAIARLSDRIGAVTGELRGFARRRAGVQRPVSLAEVMDGAALILREQLRAVTLTRPTIDPALMVSGGKVRLEQVLVNILQNALDALRGRSDPRVEIDLALSRGRATLSVTDNGPGLAPDVAGRLFTPFVTSRADGLGLGLVISHDIMVELGGTLRHVADYGGAEGARFEIEMVRV